MANWEVRNTLRQFISESRISTNNRFSEYTLWCVIHPIGCILRHSDSTCTPRTFALHTSFISKHYLPRIYSRYTRSDDKQNYNVYLALEHTGSVLSSRCTVLYSHIRLISGRECGRESGRESWRESGRPHPWNFRIFKHIFFLLIKYLSR